jgi:hypothetical protein
MERLTKRLSSGAPTYNYPASCYFDDDSGPDKIAQSAFRQRCVERLADYEDSACEPEEVLPKDKADEIALKLMRLADLESLCSYTRLRELSEADKDGRLVVLPCKVGDKLYRVFAGEIFEHRVGSMKYFAIQGQWDIETYPFCPYVESSIGKTIFLTREEAKAALEAMKDD